MALLDALRDFLGILEIGIVIMIIVEGVKFVGALGGGSIGSIRGLPNLKPPKIFGNAARREEAETRRDQTQERAEEAVEMAAEGELGEAEQLVGQDIAEAEQIRNFLSQIERTPLTPEGAKLIAEKKGSALESAVKKLLNYSKVATKEVEKAEKQNYKALRTLNSELKRRAVIDARAERDKIPRDQKDARARAYDSALRRLQQQNEAYISRIKGEGLQAAKAEKQIDSTLEQVEHAEQEVMNQVNSLIQALSRGDTHAATSATTNAIRSLQSAEAGLTEAKKFIPSVRKQIGGIVGQLYSTRRGLNKERLEEHFESSKAQQI